MKHLFVATGCSAHLLPIEAGQLYKLFQTTTFIRLYLCLEDVEDLIINFHGILSSPSSSIPRLCCRPKKNYPAFQIGLRRKHGLLGRDAASRAVLMTAGLRLDQERLDVPDITSIKQDCLDWEYLNGSRTSPRLKLGLTLMIQKTGTTRTHLFIQNTVKKTNQEQSQYVMFASDQYGELSMHDWCGKE